MNIKLTKDKKIFVKIKWNNLIFLDNLKFITFKRKKSLNLFIYKDLRGFRVAKKMRTFCNFI